MDQLQDFFSRLHHHQSLSQCSPIWGKTSQNDHIDNKALTGRLIVEPDAFKSAPLTCCPTVFTGQGGHIIRQDERRVYWSGPAGSRAGQRVYSCRWGGFSYSFQSDQRWIIHIRFYDGLHLCLKGEQSSSCPHLCLYTFQIYCRHICTEIDYEVKHIFWLKPVVLDVLQSCNVSFRI